MDLDELSEDQLKGLLSSLEHYQSIPVDMDTFLDDKYYLGAYFGEKGIQPYWREFLKKVFDSPFNSEQWLICLRGAIGQGKCLQKDSTIIKYDGTVVKVQDLVPGDLIMGPDSKSRTILSTHADTGPMFEINPIKGDPWVCNDVHVLTLKKTPQGLNRYGNTRGSTKPEIIDVALDEYLNWSKSQKNLYKLFRVPVDFPEQHPRELDPYFLGVWLGDGTLGEAQITNSDQEILSFLSDFTLKENFSSHTLLDKRTECPRVNITTEKGQPNHLRRYLRDTFSVGKHIPQLNKTGSREERLQLLAGLLDTDGHLVDNVFELTLKEEDFIDDVLFVARSLGFGTSKKLKQVKLKTWDKPRDYFRIKIFGDLDKIPTKVKRKQASPRRQKKDPLKTGFSVIPKGPGEYFGFELDGDGRFLLEDFTVTHNTTIACVGISYDIHRLLCLYNPQGAFGLLPDTIILFAIFNVTMALAQDVVWQTLSGMFARSPYFTEIIKKLPKQKPESNPMFPKNIGLFIGSRLGHTLGKAVFSCLPGSVPIPTIHGEVPLIEIVRNPGDHKVFSYDTALEKAVLGEVTHGQSMGTKEVWKIFLSNGHFIEATQDHKFLLSNNSYKTLAELDYLDALTFFVPPTALQVSSSPVLVVSKEIVGMRQVYDISVEPHHNFATSAGIFAHNCFAGDTEIPLLDGSVVKIKDLVGNYKDKYTISVDLTRKSVVPGKIIAAAKTGTRKVYKVTFDNGKSFKCTADHKILHRSGKYKELRYFEVGDAVFSINSHTGKSGHTKIRNPYTGEYEALHHHIMAWKLGNKLGYNIHHKDLDKLNNNPENLCLLSKSKAMSKFYSEDNREEVLRVRKAGWRTRILKKSYREYSDTGFIPDINVNVLRKYFNDDITEYLECVKEYNHKIVSIEYVGVEDVYDITVDKYHNFTTQTNVVVSNCLIDEANFEIVHGQVYESFLSILRRMESRFSSNAPVGTGRVWLVSSESQKNSTLNRIINSYKGKSGCLVSQASLWEVYPERYGTTTFQVFTGVDTRAPEVITEATEDLVDLYPEKIIEVPTEHKESFEADIYAALKDLAGIEVGGGARLFRLKDKLNKMLIGPTFFPDVVTLDFDGPDQIQNFSSIPFDFKRIPRCIHLDLALTGDRLGIASSYIVDFAIRTTRDPIRLIDVRESRPKIQVDFAFAISPVKGKQIPLYKIRSFISWLSSIGYPIHCITADSFQCFLSTTLVPTDSGYKEIKDIEVGDLIQSRSGPKKVLNKWGFGEQETLKITTQEGLTVEGTGKHKIEVAKNLRNYKAKRASDARWEWLRLDEIQIGDVVRTMSANETLVKCPVVPLEPPAINTDIGKFKDFHYPETLDEELAEFLGYFSGDGCADTYCIRLTCNRDDSLDYKQVVGNLVGDRYLFSECNDRYADVIYLHSKTFITWLNHYKLLDKSSIPELIWKSPVSVQAAFLRGLFSSDGTCSKEDGRVSINTATPQIAEDVQLMLQCSFGIRSNRSEHFREGFGKTIYFVTLSGPRQNFYTQIGFSTKRKIEILEKHLNIKGRNLLYKVQSIEGSKGLVFDIEVEDDPSYVANGFVSHNSADLLQQLKRQGFKTFVQSVDKTTDAYVALRNTIYEGDCVLPNNKILKRELEELEFIKDGKKVDHPVVFGDGIPGSKDVADAVAGSVWTCVNEADTFRAIRSAEELAYKMEAMEQQSHDIKDQLWPQLARKQGRE